MGQVVLVFSWDRSTGHPRQPGNTDIVCTGANAGEVLANDAQVDGQQQSVDPLGNVAELLADHGYPILANTSWTLQCQC